MYCIDTLERLNLEQVQHEREKILSGEGVACDYCDNKATQIIDVYNPADALRNVSGAYCVINICDDCFDNGYHLEENFYCPDCGELFIVNHSWDVLAVSLDGEYYCQKCALNYMNPVTVKQLLADLECGATEGWVRMNGVPGHEELWSGEFSQWPDFPGHTSFKSIIQEIKDVLRRKRLRRDTEVYPLITQGYQFSVVLSVFLA